MPLKPPEVPDWVRSVLILDPKDVWGNVVGMGLAELAASLTTAKRLDRRGNVIFVDNFEMGLCGYRKVGSAAGYSLALSNLYSYAGAFSCKITAPSGDGEYAYLSKMVGGTFTSALGVEAAFQLWTNVKYVLVLALYYDGATRYQATLRYVVSTDTWEYRDSTENYQPLLSNANVTRATNLFYPTKLVFNPASNKYVRALVSGQEVDMADYAIDTKANTTRKRFEAAIYVYSEGANQGIIYVDNVILTQNEPV